MSPGAFFGAFFGAYCARCAGVTSLTVPRDCEVKAIHAFGCFVEFLPGLEGLVHVSELDVGRVVTAEGFLADKSQVRPSPGESDIFFSFVRRLSTLLIGGITVGVRRRSVLVNRSEKGLAHVANEITTANLVSHSITLVGTCSRQSQQRAVKGREVRSFRNAILVQYL